MFIFHTRWVFLIKAEPSTSDGGTFWGRFLFKIPHRPQDKEGCMSQNGCGRYGQSGGCHPGVQWEDPGGHWTWSWWLNSAQMGVCSCPGADESSTYQTCQCAGFGVSPVEYTGCFPVIETTAMCAAASGKMYYIYTLYIYIYIYLALLKSYLFQISPAL